MTGCSTLLSPVVFSGGIRGRQKLFVLIIVCVLLFLPGWYYTGPNTSGVSRWVLLLKRLSLESPTIGTKCVQQTAITGFDDGFKTRLKRVEDFCTRKQRNNTACQNGDDACQFDTLIIDENTKTMFCAIPKVASTIWETKMVLMTGKEHPDQIPVHGWKVLAPYNLFGWKAYSKSERAYRMSHYFKFVFVRHPLTRLLSAYREKIEKGTNPYAKAILHFMIQHINTKRDNSPISFQEFASFIVGNEGPLARDRHWIPYNNLCRFCEVRYDFIGRQELLEKESSYLLETQFHRPEHADFNNSLHRTFSDLEVARKYYSQLTEETKQGLLQLYGEDMEMFGYTSTGIF